MNHLFLLKLLADMLELDKPSADKIQCARLIVKNMISEYDKPGRGDVVSSPSIDAVTSENLILDADAQVAKQELME